MQQSGNPEEFIESVKVDLFPDKVYVFTPKGAILRLPRGATVVDFAYAVHTDIGNRCVAAKLDRRLTPLRTVLRNGQTGQIITANGAQPNPAWVNFVVSAKARSAIRHYLKSMHRSEAVELGKQMLNAALTEFNLDVDTVAPAAMAQTLASFGLHQRDELFEKVGLGERLAPLTARLLLPDDANASHSPPTPLAVAGTEGLLVSYAPCCHPIPGDPIIAYLSAGRGIEIHRDSCSNVEGYHKHPEKWQPVSWQQDIDRQFSSEVRVEGINKVGLLASVSAAIADTQTNIAHVSISQRDGDVSVITLEIDVRDRIHLARILRRIHRMPEVLRVTRNLVEHQARNQRRNRNLTDTPEEP
jgi:GTP pyrophosphokinase